MALAQRAAPSLKGRTHQLRMSSRKVSVTARASSGSTFDIPGSVTITEDRGLPAVKLTHQNGSAATVHLFGACVTSWTQPSGDEVLYVRPDAVFDKSKPIRYED